MKKALLIILLILFTSTIWAAEVTLKWSPVLLSTGYKIYYSVDGVTWLLLLDVGNVNEFVVKDAPETGTILYRIVAYSPSGEFRFPVFSGYDHRLR